MQEIEQFLGRPARNLVIISLNVPSAATTTNSILFFRGFPFWGLLKSVWPHFRIALSSSDLIYNN